MNPKDFMKGEEYFMKKMESRRIFVTLLTVGSLGGLGLESTLAGHHGCHVSFGGGHHHHHAVGVSPVLLYSSLYRPSHPSYHSYGTSSSSSLGYTVPAVNPPVLREIPPPTSWRCLASAK